MDRKALAKALRDTAQSASNTIAGSVSGPVDLIAMGLRGVGLPIPQNPVGGSQWMAERGLTAPVQQGAAQVVGDTLGLVGPALATQFAPQIAGALNQAGANLAAPRKMSSQSGMAYVPFQDDVARLRGRLADPQTFDTPVGQYTIQHAGGQNVETMLRVPGSSVSTRGRGRSWIPLDWLPNADALPDAALQQIKKARSQMIADARALDATLDAKRGLMAIAPPPASAPSWAVDLVSMPTSRGAVQPADARWWSKTLKDRASQNFDAFAQGAANSNLMMFGPRTNATNIQDIAKNYGVSVVDDAANTIRLKTPNGGELSIINANTPNPYIRSVSANSAGKKEGGGKALYQAALEWASNNGKVINPDPSGISEINQLRKLGNVLSAQVRSGGNPVAVINSAGIDDVARVPQIWRSELKMASSRVPAINNVTFDGKSFNMSDADITRIIKANDPSFSQGVGVMTAKRAAIARWLETATPDNAKKAAAALAAIGAGPVFAQDKQQNGLLGIR